MLNDQEKRKGLPRGGGLMYLISGIVIGVFGVLAVMFVLTMPSCACTPQPTPTFTVPYIPTPNPGVTGTASAHTVQTSQTGPYRLRAFQVDTENNLVALSYTNGSESTLETRPWPPSLGDTPTVVLAQGQTIYDGVGFKKPRTVLATSDSNYGFYNILYNLSEAVPFPSQTSPSVYSDDNLWMVSFKGKEMIFEPDPASRTTVTFKGVPMTGAFNHVGDRLAVITSDEKDAGSFRLSIYTIPDMHLHYEDTFKGPLTSSLVFSADDAYLAMAASKQMYIVPQVSGSMKTFVIGPAGQHSIAFERANAWVAVAGGNPDVGETSVLIAYTLTQDAAQSPDTPLTEIVLADEIIGLQYTDTLLIGHRTGIDSVNVRLDPPWITMPLLSAFQDGFMYSQ